MQTAALIPRPVPHAPSPQIVAGALRAGLVGAKLAGASEEALAVLRLLVPALVDGGAPQASPTLLLLDLAAKLLTCLGSRPMAAAGQRSHGSGPPSRVIVRPTRIDSSCCPQPALLLFTAVLQLCDARHERLKSQSFAS